MAEIGRKKGEERVGSRERGATGERRRKRVEFGRATCLHRRRSRKNGPRVLFFFFFTSCRRLSPPSFDGAARRGLKKI